MLNRRWIIDEAGRLVGTWIDSNLDRVALTELSDQPILNAVRVSESRTAVVKRWFRCLRMRNIARNLILTVAFVAFLIGAACAEAGGKITGTVKDQTGGVMPWGIVSALNTATGVAVATTTNEEGAYAFPVLPVGQYEIDGTANGFRP